MAVVVYQTIFEKELRANKAVSEEWNTKQEREKVMQNKHTHQGDERRKTGGRDIMDTMSGVEAK